MECLVTGRGQKLGLCVKMMRGGTYKAFYYLIDLNYESTFSPVNLQIFSTNEIRIFKILIRGSWPVGLLMALVNLFLIDAIATIA